MSTVIRKVYHTAQFVLIEQTKHIYVQQPLSHRDDCVTSHCIYQFTCNCGNSYIGRTNHHLKSRVNEHIPKWLLINMEAQDFPNNSHDRRPISSIAQHLVGSGHRLQDPSSNNFRILFRNCKGRMVHFIEALAIRTMNPTLCVQKLLILALQLPW